jgi:L-fuculose-phosphate aldolase
MNHLHLSSFATERDLRLSIIEAGRIAYANGLMPANSGSISARLGNDRVVSTPWGLCKGRLDPEDLLIVDLDGNLIKADGKLKRKVAFDLRLHLEVYRQRTEVRAVIRAHPSNATALTVAGIPFPVDILPEVLTGLGPVPTTRFALPDSDDSVQAIRELVGRPEHHAVLLRNQGALTFGADLDEALNHLELLESVARTVVTAQLLGTVNRLPDEMMAALRELYFRS